MKYSIFCSKEHSATVPLSRKFKILAVKPYATVTKVKLPQWAFLKLCAMTQNQIEELQKILIAEQAKLDTSLNGMGTKDEHIKGNFRTEFPDFGAEEGENAAEFASYESDVAVEQHLEQMLVDVNEALLRIKDGVFGLCMRCDTEIPFPRLQAFPSAKYCVKCSNK